MPLLMIFSNYLIYKTLSVIFAMLKNSFSRKMLLGMALFSLMTGRATGQTNSHEMVWMRYYNKIVFKNKLSLHTELEDRRFAFPDRQSDWLLPRVHLHKTFDNGLDIGGGTAFFIHAFPADPEKNISYNSNEIRPHVVMSYNKPMGKFSLHNRYQAEWRLFEKDNGYGNSIYRFRYLVQLSYTINDNLSLTVFNDVMINAGPNVRQNIFDQNWLYGAVHYKFNPSLALEVGYMNIYQQPASGNGFIKRNLLRVTLFHTISLDKKS